MPEYVYYNIGKGKMITTPSEEWVADFGTMTCRNINNQIVVVFEKKGNSLIGKINDMPIELMEKWAAIPHGENYMKKAVMEAEEIFLKAYFEQN